MWCAGRAFETIRTLEVVDEAMADEDRQMRTDP